MIMTHTFRETLEYAWADVDTCCIKTAAHPYPCFKPPHRGVAPHYPSLVRLWEGQPLSVYYQTLH